MSSLSTLEEVEDDITNKLLHGVGCSKRAHAIIQARIALGMEADGYLTNHMCDFCSKTYNLRRLAKECGTYLDAPCTKCGKPNRPFMVDALWAVES